MSQFKGCKYASCRTVTSFTNQILVVQVISQKMNLLSFYVSKIIAIILLKRSKKQRRLVDITQHSHSLAGWSHSESVEL